MTDPTAALQACAARLLCPHHDPGDQIGLEVTASRSLGCAHGHRFDPARQGYVNLLRGPAPAAADTAAMVAARQVVLDAGLQTALTRTLQRLIIEHLGSEVSHPDADAPLLVDVGAGTAHHTAAVLEVLADHLGVAVDVSRYAARRAAKAHPRLASVVADVWERLPVLDGAASVLLDVFAPRDPAAFARVLAPGGLLVIAVPAPDHLAPLVDRLGLLSVGGDKLDRLRTRFAVGFTELVHEHVGTELPLDRRLVRAVATMGPSAHHLDPEALDLAIDDLPEPLTVRQEMEVIVLRRES